MRLKALKISYLLIILLMCSACADDSMRASADSSMLSSLRSSYRSADLIAAVTCSGFTKSSDGTSLASLEPIEIIAGKNTDAVICCKGGEFLSGSSYVVYLSHDEATGELLPLAVIPYDTGSHTLTQGENTLRLADLQADIVPLQKIVSAPPELLYYRTAKELADASDAVFIGRVEQLPALADTDFREESGTGVVEHSRPASIAKLKVYGSIKGELPYGGQISFVYSPAFAGDIVDASSLTAYPCTEADIPALTQGAYYLFFLKSSPDPKQDHYFGVNPLQSHASLNGDTLGVAAKNEALSAYLELPELLTALRG